MKSKEQNVIKKSVATPRHNKNKNTFTQWTTIGRRRKKYYTAYKKTIKTTHHYHINYTVNY